MSHLTDLILSARKVAISHSFVSVGLLQRNLKLPYQECAELINALVEIGVVDSNCESKYRKVLVKA